MFSGRNQNGTWGLNGLIISLPRRGQKNVLTVEYLMSTNTNFEALTMRFFKNV